jgi:fructose-1,6-bisphosphatase/inositol monophosphatase family enzyme
VQIDQVSDLLKDVAERLVLPRFTQVCSGEPTAFSPSMMAAIADREAEVEISQRLRAADPAALVIGEQAVFADPQILDELPSADHVWVVDPVDGTRNFSKGIPDFAVMVAELRHGQTVRSWIWQPVHELLYVAELGSGVSCNGSALRAVASPRTVPLGATYLAMPGEDAATVELIRSWGSCGVDYPNLVTGELDFLCYRSLFPWDHLPGGLMVTEMNGRIAANTGQDYRPGVIARWLLAASSAELWDQAQHSLFADLVR